MLTGDLVKPRLKQRKGQVKVDWLDPGSDHWQQSARELIALFAQHQGKARQRWDIVLDTYLCEGTKYTVVRGLVKVVEYAAEFHQIDPVITPAELRRKLFMRGPAFINT